jgi:hypothetical protein
MLLLGRQPMADEESPPDRLAPGDSSVAALPQNDKHPDRSLRMTNPKKNLICPGLPLT